MFFFYEFFLSYSYHIRPSPKKFGVTKWPTKIENRYYWILHFCCCFFFHESFFIFSLPLKQVDILIKWRENNFCVRFIYVKCPETIQNGFNVIFNFVLTEIIDWVNIDWMDWKRRNIVNGLLSTKKMICANKKIIIVYVFCFDNQL